MKTTAKVVTILYVCGMLLGCSHTPQATALTPTHETTSLGDNSRVSLDWNGTYRGTTPCADCEGIKTELILSLEGKYQLSLHYLGKSTTPFIEKGKFYWDESGSRIHLEGMPGGLVKYRVGENRLILLDQDGKEITSAAGSYELTKSSSQALIEGEEPQIQEVYWKLIGIMGKAIVLEEKQREPYIMLKIENNRVQGFGGCNLIMGSYELKEGNRIAFTRMATTMMACPNLEEEHAFLKVLERADNYTVKEGVMMLHKARTAPLATFEAVYLQ